MNNRNQFPRLGLLLAAVPLMLSNIASIPFFDVERADRLPAQDAADDLPDETIPEGITKDEIDTSRTADAKTATGDSLRIDNLERPFTQDGMAYHPETDILAVTIAEDETYYYFSFELKGNDAEKGYPSATYGIEFDSDLDLRGETLLWVIGGQESQWNNEGVSIYQDKNGDVGGARAVIPDAFAGDGYETLAHPESGQETTDFGWKRAPAGKEGVIQLAIRKTLIERDYFFWKAWADGGAAAPALFDYNDTFSNTQAGSPDKNSAVYPVKELELADSTCWAAYGFQPTREQTGCCYKAPAKIKVKKQGEPELPPS